MAYDPNTVIARYQKMLDVPEGEPTEVACALMKDGGRMHDTLNCEPGGCASCCVGLVEVTRQFSERAAKIEIRSLEFTDTLTTADRLTQSEGASATDSAGSRDHQD